MGNCDDKYDFSLRAVDQRVRERARKDLLPVVATDDRPTLWSPRDMFDLARGRSFEASNKARTVVLRTVPIGRSLQVRYGPPGAIGPWPA
jgi:hypothetical protein